MKRVTKAEWDIIEDALSYYRYLVAQEDADGSNYFDYSVEDLDAVLEKATERRTQ